ncbi:MAG: hypothetical protein ACK4P4_08225 [Allorhizobium sp.]
MGRAHEHQARLTPLKPRHVAVLVPATLLGLQLGAAGFLHEGSTVLVVINALRLLAYPDQSEKQVLTRSSF